MKTTTAFTFLSLALCYASTSPADTFGSGSNIFGVEFVTIGNPGNDSDPADGDALRPGTQNYGSVGYTYRLGRYEITEDVINKANAQSNLDGNPLGITKDSRGPDKPATSVTWYEAAKFVNWLNTDAGSTPAYKFDGGGNFQLWQPGDAGYDPNNRYRNSQAKYFLPSVHEWYKAAFHDASAGTAATYFLYSTGSDSVPTAVASGTTPGSAVYAQSFLTGPTDVTLAGGLSPYGTMGQSGNVWEWEETDFDLINDFSFRGLRGGDWDSNLAEVSSFERHRGGAGQERRYVGFRVASIAVPEPTTCGLAIIATLCLAVRRRRIDKPSYLLPHNA